MISWFPGWNQYGSSCNRVGLNGDHTGNDYLGLEVCLLEPLNRLGELIEHYLSVTVDKADKYGHLIVYIFDQWPEQVQSR